MVHINFKLCLPAGRWFKTISEPGYVECVLYVWDFLTDEILFFVEWFSRYCYQDRFGETKRRISWQIGVTSMMSGSFVRRECR